MSAPKKIVQVFGIKLVGVDAENAHKLLASIIFVAFVMLVGWALCWVAHHNAWDHRSKRFAFWTHQGISIAVAILTILGLASIWLTILAA
ncbi:MAG: hypothetical protein JO033_29470 [Acidobacteriaceae bacterium]|nr:hypothetical protein [Acidobacteriaceae bacterium]MBV9500693.1 hypothetical protein [Acidobacteriaceae bacterium]